MVFNNTVESDFQKLVTIPEAKKGDLIDFAGVDFYTIKDNLVEYIKTVYPLDYNNFIESDLGVMILELVAYMGAVTSFKADFLANENMIRTAQQRDSVRKLLEIIGVTLRGPVGAAANAKLTLSTEPSDGELLIEPNSRVITISSPEDGAALNYTLYKVSNGTLENVNFGGNLALDTSETDNPTGTPASSVYTNVALLEGVFVTQSGTFTTLNSTRKIALTEAPVVEGSVEVFIDAPSDLTSSGAYRRVDNLYFASGSEDNVYQIVYNDEYNATVLFGDGILGNPPPVNATYFVSYRVGGGSRGNLLNDVINNNITVLSDSNPITTRVENISLATGGTEAETIEHAKKYGPLTFKQQNRLVSLEDFTSFANRFVSPTGATGKAIAVTRKAYSSGNIIDIYALEKASDLQLQKASPTYKEDLLEAISPLRLATTEVVVADGLIRTLDLVVTARIDRELRSKENIITQKIKEQILTFFNTDNSDFGKTFVIGELTREIFKTKEVVYATVDNLPTDIHVEFNEIIQLNNFTINIEFL